MIRWAYCSRAHTHTHTYTHIHARTHTHTHLEPVENACSKATAKRAGAHPPPLSMCECDDGTRALRACERHHTSTTQQDPLHSANIAECLGPITVVKEAYDKGKKRRIAMVKEAYCKHCRMLATSNQSTDTATACDRDGQAHRGCAAARRLRLHRRLCCGCRILLLLPLLVPRRPVITCMSVRYSCLSLSLSLSLNPCSRRLKDNARRRGYHAPN